MARLWLRVQTGEAKLDWPLERLLREKIDKTVKGIKREAIRELSVEDDVMIKHAQIIINESNRAGSKLPNGARRTEVGGARLQITWCNLYCQ